MAAEDGGARVLGREKQGNDRFFLFLLSYFRPSTLCHRKRRSHFGTGSRRSQKRQPKAAPQSGTSAAYPICHTRKTDGALSWVVVHLHLLGHCHSRRIHPARLSTLKQDATVVCLPHQPGPSGHCGACQLHTAPSKALDLQTNRRRGRRSRITPDAGHEF
ncbi:hypothetical protein GGTG_10314 [Gaeumannomyces tritici R3-111a-1]|uniref:Uncharacterized protein n=1 Tax=Gaeumannomyces tritici (strain R3-111a-1) TaxID=644352 RepID=J3P9Z0_GAET3|nr:hypothetical protein GGTG_10314 [Gaeumannomyces tritici R3-111a-1]EJT73476.1 hypothetical protein GGTG_10314 [Gaeumannomyces tritici R3-111a-1]